MPLQQTSGNVTQDAYGGGKAAVPVYVENVFSTYLYIGNGTSQTITNNIDLTDNGGMVWIKDRNDAYNHVLTDTTRGASSYLSSNQTTAATTSSSFLTSFNTNGFSVGSAFGVNISGANLASWTFRKQPKFFDIVTWTGDGSSSWRYINHNLQALPGVIIVKNLSESSDWLVYSPIAAGSGYDMILNSSAPSQSSNENNGRVYATSTTQFQVVNQNSSGGSVTGINVNKSGDSYVAYLFGPGGTGGFGLTGTQDIISCGSFTDGGNFSVNLGWEPQWILYKRADAASDWYITDVMRGESQTATVNLRPDTSGAESSIGAGFFAPTATGFVNNTAGAFFSPGATVIYIAIRRGPMATPTTGTSVFSPNTGTPSTPNIVTTGFPVDMVWADSNGAANGPYDLDRLRGDSTTNGNYLLQYRTNAETNNSSYGIGFDSNTYIADNFTYNVEGYSGTQTYWNFARAPGFFDIVCYTGTGSATTITHNLGVVPQLIIIKDRSLTTNWPCYNATLGATNYVFLNSNSAYGTTINFWNNTTPTSTVFSLGSGNANVNGSGDNYVAYLFATVTGVSYVGSYTGNGTGQSIACGFGASGARFILIKRTDSTGNWYVFDSANGLTSSSSPYFILNTASTPTTGNNGVYASSGGFTLGSTASTTTNISSASYIFLAVS